MTILMITDLYPPIPGVDLSASALHRFCRVWARTENVWVLRPRIRPDWHGKSLPVKREWKAEGVDVVSVAVYKLPLYPRFRIAALERWTRRIQPDVVVGHLGFNLEFAARLAERFDLPLVAGVHMGDLERGPRMLGERRLAEIFGQATRITPRSPAVRRRFLERYAHLRSRCRMAWSGLDVAGYLPEDSGPRRMRAMDDASPLRVMTACQLVPLKGVDVTLRSLANLRSGRQWHFTVVGDGPERGRLERLSSELGLANRVFFTGHLKRGDLREMMAGAHLFVMVSAPETFGLVYLEAMAAGCLVMGGRGNGIDGIVTHGRNGWLCPAEDVAAQTDLLDSIMKKSPDELATVAAAARRTAGYMTEDKAGAGYLKTIHEAVSEGRRE